MSEKRFPYGYERTFPKIVDEIGIGLGDIGRNGSGVTKLVHTLVNVEYGHPEVVEELMGDIDTILDAEAEVTDIKCRQIRSGKSGSKGKWQVLLDIDGKEIYAENFGAGLRMVLMVCLFCNSRLTEELLGPDNSKRECGSGRTGNKHASGITPPFPEVP
ncbi:MAG: hypothetical protein U5N86_13485 [Planctomycetota bacterium]|nr:hypothetical protein [Planctomycetota bacterium]